MSGYSVIDAVYYHGSLRESCLLRFLPFTLSESAEVMYVPAHAFALRLNGQFYAAVLANSLGISVLVSHDLLGDNLTSSLVIRFERLSLNRTGSPGD